MAARAATSAKASGRWAQRVMISATACGSAATRSALRRRTSSCRASSSVSKSRVIGWAPSAAIRPLSWLRLVTTTKQPGAPGSNART
jgi:hypothetical protein